MATEDIAASRPPYAVEIATVSSRIERSDGSMEFPMPIIVAVAITAARLLISSKDDTGPDMEFPPATATSAKQKAKHGEYSESTLGERGLVWASLLCAILASSRAAF